MRLCRLRIFSHEAERGCQAGQGSLSRQTAAAATPSGAGVKSDDKIRFKICIITDNETRCFVYSNVIQTRLGFDSNIRSISSFNLN